MCTGTMCKIMTVWVPLGYGIKVRRVVAGQVWRLDHALRLRAKLQTYLTRAIIALPWGRRVCLMMMVWLKKREEGNVETICTAGLVGAGGGLFPSVFEMA